MITCTRRIQFCAGHRVYGHESKCANPHGHNYVLFVEAFADYSDGVDDIGRVIDFSVLKQKIGGWIEENWDHGFIYFSGDPEMTKLFFGGAAYKAFELPANPTAENMATYLLNHVCPKLLVNTPVAVRRVTLYETENCYATAEVFR
jgi:6-pyruvoyltetrahydropterin/6-carboxytetrahydropterin synthase